MKRNTIISIIMAFGFAAGVAACGDDAKKSEEKMEKKEVATAGEITIATEGAYPPFNTKDAAGELGGFDVEIAKALCEEMKKTCKIVAQDWDGIIPGLEAKKYDAIVASMSITDERKQKVAFTNPYYSNYLQFVAKKDAFADTAALEGKTIGAQRSTVASKWLEDNMGSKATVKLYDTQTAAYEDLKNGRLDAILSDIYPAHDWLKENGEYAFVGEKIDIDDKIGIAVRKDDKELVKAFNDALEAIRSNGKYEEINKKYFPFDIF